MRLEPAVGGQAIDSAAALGWADAAEAVVREMAASGGAKAAGALARPGGGAFSARCGPRTSPTGARVLVSGFEQRLGSLRWRAVQTC